MYKAEHFEPERFMRWLLLAAPWVCGALAALGLALPFLPDDDKPGKVSSELGLSVVLILFFGALAWLSWRAVRELPDAAVTLDKQGIWKTAHPRDSALVRWADIARVRERPHLQRLELLDRSGAVLLRLEYYLHDFPRLRDIVLERSALESARTALGQTLTKGTLYHLFNIAALIGFSALGVFLWPTNPVVSGVLFLALVGSWWEYFTRVYKLEILPTELVLSWPLRRLALSRTEVVAVEIVDRIVKHARHPQVLLTHTKSPKAVVLRALGPSAVELKRSIQAWLRNAA